MNAWIIFSASNSDSNKNLGILEHSVKKGNKILIFFRLFELLAAVFKFILYYLMH